MLNYNPDYCKLFAFPLSCHTSCRLVWSDRYATCFSSINKNVTSGLMAVSLRTLYINDSMLVDNNVQHLLGMGSIALAKSQHGRIVTSQHILYYCTYHSVSLTCTVHTVHCFIHSTSAGSQHLRILRMTVCFPTELSYILPACLVG